MLSLSQCAKPKGGFEEGITLSLLAKAIIEQEVRICPFSVSKNGFCKRVRMGKILSLNLNCGKDD
jgi:hypothetical protein